MKREMPPKIPIGLDPDSMTPSGWDRTREIFWQLPRRLSGLGPLGPRGPEDGPPALVIPGFLSSDRSTMELRRALARGGWRAHPWELGVNRGAKADTLQRIAARIDTCANDRKPLLIGWSLGGLFARQAAHAYPDKVRAVVTIASPFSGDFKTNNNVRWLYEKVAGHDVNMPPFPTIRMKPPVPTLAFWSRHDGIVAPAAARGTAQEVDKAIELDTHHYGAVVWRPALSQIVREIRTFLTEMEGKAPF